MIEQIERLDSEGVVYYRGSLNGETYAHAMTKESGDEAVIHTHYTHLTKGTITDGIKMLEVIKANLRLKGINKVSMAGLPCGNEKWNKFISEL